MHSESAALTSHAIKCDLAGEVLRTSGRLRLKVTGWSMLPTVRPGDALTIDQATIDCISSGDIVLFRRDGRLFVHRVIQKSDNAGLITQGDGMPHSDPPVSSGEVLGKVSSIMRDGKSLEPSSRLSLSGRAVAALVRRSPSAARVVVGVHNLCAARTKQVPACQN